ncbi:MAG: GNAT family N-acetyltransferase [Sphingobacteriales bacterium]|nr:GNAT family N-acetyltransferase [Sphingobacteriales bacterium]MBI3720851.1 GNAT family N-acetyltransferase [Sphingobacteriales bacterium]
MREFITTESFDGPFWSSYTILWQNSGNRSPFQSPALLQYFTREYKGRIVSLQLKKHDQLLAAALLKEADGVYGFLSDLKTDVNFFVFHENCTKDDYTFFFSSFLKLAHQKNWSVLLNNIPSWATYIPDLEKCLTTTRLFWRNINYSVSPAIVGSSPEEFYAFATRTTKHRYAFNRLKKQLQAEFEILTDPSGIDEWFDEFYKAHILRWSNTATPSSFLKETRQVFFRNCLEAWSKDNILVLFSVKVNGQRVGFVVGLKSSNVIIYHSTTYNTLFSKYSPTKALVYFMAGWMKENNLSVLDFGDGDESYKYQFANENQVMNRIMIAPKTNISFIIKALIIKTVRSNRQAYEFYRNKIKKIIKFTTFDLILAIQINETLTDLLTGGSSVNLTA